MKNNLSKNFIALDFETAQGYRHSICQVGIVKYENGEIVDELNLLVQPPNNYYWPRFIDIHGITHQMTANAPFFDGVWHQIKPYIENQLVVAHNGLSFDFPVLKATLSYYKLEEPTYHKADLYRIYG